MTGIAGFFNVKELGYQLPIALLVLGGVFVLMGDAFAKGRDRKWLMWLATATTVATMASALLIWSRLDAHGGRVPIFSGMLVADRFSTFLVMVLSAGAALTLLLSSDYLKEHAVDFGEFYSLVLFATAGMVILVMASDLVTIFLGIETMSVAVYVMTGSIRRSRRSAEAALKYFLTGAFATGFLVYGIALVYGAAGTTNLAAIALAGGTLASQPLFIVGEMLLIGAFCFKIAAVPFHMWAPDAYEGAPTPVTAFMAAGVKAAAFAAMLRLFLTAFGGDVLPFGRMGWATILGIIAAVTMTVGNLAALKQDNVKRMLAYSSISHAGYLLVGLVAAGVGGAATRHAAVSSTLFYLLAYTFTTVGAFGVVAWLGRKNDERLMVDDWAGLAARHPLAAFSMTLFLLSLGGMPPLAGFFGKFYIFRAAMDTPGDQLTWLVVIAALNSVVSIYYYLRLVVAMYFRDPTRECRPLGGTAITLSLTLAALFVIEMGLLPGRWLDWAAKAAQSLVGAP